MFLFRQQFPEDLGKQKKVVYDRGIKLLLKILNLFLFNVEADFSNRRVDKKTKLIASLRLVRDGEISDVLKTELNRRENTHPNPFLILKKMG